MRIFLDAGHNHSGWNTGAVGNGMREQDITFEVTAELGRILERAGFEVRLSRPTLETNLGHDNNSAVNARWQMANAWGADYFISLHVNAGGGTGAETLYYRGDSLEFATVMQDVYSKAMGLRSRRVWHRMDIGVLRHTQMPSILVELAFIDSPANNPDLDILRNRRTDMAAAVAKGLFEYLGINFEEDEDMDMGAEERFNSISEVPAWAQDTITRLVERGLLQGDGDGLDLSRDMVRIFVVHDRAGLYSITN